MARVYSWNFFHKCLVVGSLKSLLVEFGRKTKVYGSHTSFSGPQKGPAERGHVKKRQKSSRIVKKKFQKYFRHFSRRAKEVKNRQKVSKIISTLFDNFRAARQFSGPFWGPLTSWPLG